MNRCQISGEVQGEARFKNTNFGNFVAVFRVSVPQDARFGPALIFEVVASNEAARAIEREVLPGSRIFVDGFFRRERENNHDKVVVHAKEIHLLKSFIPPWLSRNRYCDVLLLRIFLKNSGKILVLSRQTSIQRYRRRVTYISGRASRKEGQELTWGLDIRQRAKRLLA
jgi:Single-strand binding protein family